LLEIPPFLKLEEEIRSRRGSGQCFEDGREIRVDIASGLKKCG